MGDLCNQLKILGEDDQLNLDDGIQAGCVDSMSSSQFPSVPKHVETLATLFSTLLFFGMSLTSLANLFVLQI